MVDAAATFNALPFRLEFTGLYRCWKYIFKLFSFKSNLIDILCLARPNYMEYQSFINIITHIMCGNANVDHVFIHI